VNQHYEPGYDDEGNDRCPVCGSEDWNRDPDCPQCGAGELDDDPDRGVCYEPDREIPGEEEEL
jgi:hypothetical protein